MALGRKGHIGFFWGPGGVGKGATELRCWVCLRAAGAGGWKLPHRPLPPTRGHTRILLQEGTGPDLHLSRLLRSANGNGWASTGKRSQEWGGEAQTGVRAASVWF